MTYIKGMDELLKQFNKITRQSKSVLEKSIEECASSVRDIARENCPEQTGDLRKSLDYDVEKKGNTVIGTVYTNIEYAPYVELGTGRIGEGTNKNNNVQVSYTQHPWTFYDEKNDRFVYTEGQKAQPYLYPALHDNIDEIQEKVIRDINDKLLGGDT